MNTVRTRAVAALAAAPSLARWRRGSPPTRRLRRAGTFVVAMVFALIGFGALSAAAGTQEWSVVNSFSDTTTEWVPGLAENAAGDAVAAAAPAPDPFYSSDSDTVVASVRDGASGTWGPEQTVDSVTPCQNNVFPCTTFTNVAAGVDAAGNTTLVWMVKTYTGNSVSGETGETSELVVSDRPHGGSWGSPVTVVSSSVSPELVDFQEDPQGDLLVVYQCWPDLCTIDRPAGKAWGTPQDLGSFSAGNAEAALAPGGGELLGVTSWDSTNQDETLIAYTGQIGGSWGSPHTFLTSPPNTSFVGFGGASGDLGLGRQIALNASGFGAITYEVWGWGLPSGSAVVDVATYDGGAWSSAKQLETKADSSTMVLPRVAVTPQGDAVVVADSTDGSTLVSSSYSSGGWSPLAAITSPVSGETMEEPQPVSDGQGDVVVLYNQFSSGGAYSLASVTRPAGGSFGSPTSVLASSSSLDGNVLSTADGGYALAAWTDGANLTVSQRTPGGTVAPSAVTDAASGVSIAGATLNGVVDPSGQDASYHFDYGTTTAYGQVTPTATVSGSSGATSVSATLSGLTAHTTYHFRLVDSSSGGSAQGQDMTFTTHGPAPVITGVSPASGLAKGGTSVTISGSNLSGATAVSFGSTPAGSFHVDSAGQITALSPAHAAGTVDLTVTTLDGTSPIGSADHFTFVGPEISSAWPDPGPSVGGTDAGVWGHDLSGATVRVGGQRAQVLSDGSTGIRFVLPPGQGSTPIVVQNSDGSATFPYSRYSYPLIASITPDQGRNTGGYQATITGANLQSGDTVSFGGAAATLDAQSPTQGTVTVPAGTGTVRVTIAHGSDHAPAGASAPYFTYYPTFCTGGTGRACQFAAWSEVSLIEGSTPISSHQAQSQLSVLDTQYDPTAARSSTWWCQWANLVPDPACRVLANGPVSLHITDSTYGANGGASAMANPFGSEVDLSAEAQGPVPYDATTNQYVDATGSTGNSSNASGHTVSEDTWALKPQPTSAVTVYLAVSASATSIVSSSNFDPSASDAQVTWRLDLGNWSQTPFATGTDHYHAVLTTVPNGYGTIEQFIDDDTLTIRGQPAPGGANTTLTIPVQVSPNGWNAINVFTAIDGSVTIAGCGGDSATLCTGSAQATVDPVLISADPRYKVVSKAPAGAAGQPLILSSSRLTARRHQTLILGGAGFGKHRGKVLFTQGKRTRRVRTRSWKSGQVRVRVPRKLELGGVEVRVRTSRGHLSNPVPLTIHGRVPAPVVLRLKPATARPGLRIRIIGHNLAGVRKVMFGHHRARIIHRHAQALIVRAPKGHGVLQITVTGRGGPNAATTGDIFHYRH